MSWIFEQNGASRNKQAMFQEVIANRREAEAFEKVIAANNGLRNNQAAVIPQDVWREMDSQTKMILRNDEGDVLLNDLLPLAKDLPIGKVIHQYRKASDAGVTTRSISGSVAEILDKTAYNYGKAVIPVFRNGYKREWREWEAQRSENFDGLIDDNANSVQAMRKDWADYIADGDASIVFDGQAGYGFRTDPSVIKYDITTTGGNIDYTNGTVATAEAIRNGFKAIRDVLTIDNNVNAEINVYISREISTGFESYYSDNFSTGETIQAQLLKLNNIKAIKQTALLTGNQMFWSVLNSNNIRPLVGMAVNTIAIPRQMRMDDYQFVVWGAMGMDFLSDYDGRTGNLYAANLT